MEDREFSSLEINAEHVRDYGVIIPWCHSKECNIRRIQTFKVSNFFRKIFRKPLKKPKKPKFHDYSKIRIQWSNGQCSYYYYTSVKRTLVEYHKFDSFMWNLSANKNKIH
jgi:hypothetical protein